jgi:hypothetical protein
MPQRIVTCASPAYITRHGTPRHPREIEQCVPMRDPSPENRFVARARGAIPRIARSPNHGEVRGVAAQTYNPRDVLEEFDAAGARWEHCAAVWRRMRSAHRAEEYAPSL